MSNRFWLTSDYRQRHPSAVRITSSPPKAQRLKTRLLLGATLLVLVMLLSACQVLPTKPCEMPQLPTPPALTEPLPSKTYSSKVQSDTEAWAKRVTDTSATLK